IQKNFAERVAEIRAQLAPGTPLEVWFQDEMRVGQKNKLTYRWARKGSRPRAAHDQRTQSTYLFGAVCPERGAGAALVLPACNTEAMQLHLDEIATKITPGAHAILLLDQPGGMAPRPSRFQTTSRSCSFRPAHPNSMAKKISGNSFGRTGCRTEFSNPSTISLTTAATLGTRSSISRGKSCPSPAAIGQPQVTQSEDWYYISLKRWACLIERCSVDPAVLKAGKRRCLIQAIETLGQPTPPISSGPRPLSPPPAIAPTTASPSMTCCSLGLGTSPRLSVTMTLFLTGGTASPTCSIAASRGNPNGAALAAM